MSKTIKQLLQFNNKIDRLDAELLIAYVLGKSREFVLAHLDFEVGRLKDYKIKRLFKKRAKGIPLAYLTGHKEFFGLDFFVNKNVLVPRPDTEILVEEVLSHITYHITHNKPITFIDVGTGSGCIPISITKTLENENTKTFAIDISRKALRVARKNAKKHHVKASLSSAHVAGQIKFLHGNLLSPFINLKPILSKTQNLIITANLPYITEEQFKTEPSIHHEPRLALVAKNKGLALYEELLEQIRQFYSLFLIPYSLFMEIDPSQSQSIKPLIKKYLPKAKIEIKKDLAGLDRVVVIEIKSK
ncbi:MAG: peptide chain release factor N(5)-glutamine methyltransferase [Candidatus Magasanikbacteria bacterium]